MFRHFFVQTSQRCGTRNMADQQHAHLSLRRDPDCVGISLSFSSYPPLLISRLLVSFHCLGPHHRQTSNHSLGHLAWQVMMLIISLGRVLINRTFHLRNRHQSETGKIIWLKKMVTQKNWYSLERVQISLAFPSMEKQ